MNFEQRHPVATVLWLVFNIAVIATAGFDFGCDCYEGWFQ